MQGKKNQLLGKKIHRNNYFLDRATARVQQNLLADLEVEFLTIGNREMRKWQVLFLPKCINDDWGIRHQSSNYVEIRDGTKNIEQKLAESVLLGLIVLRF